MPETSVYENHCAIFWQHNVGSTRQTLVVGAITKTTGKQSLAKLYLRLCAFRPDFRHYVGTFLGGEDVGHGNDLNDSMI